MSVCPTLVTLPIGMPFGIERAQRARPPAGGDDLVADADDVLLADAVEDERLAGSAGVAHDPGRARAQVDRRGRGRLVREQLDAREIGRDARDEADEPVGGDDRIVEAHAVVRAGRDRRSPA